MIKRVLIAGGGTGGHVFPAIALADAFMQDNPDTEILFVGAKGGKEVEWVQKAGYEIKTVWISGLHRQLTLKNLFRNALLPLKFLVAHIQSHSILKKFKPNVVIGVGGYASYTTLGVANRMKGMLRVVQEQNAFPGLTNRTHAKKAHLVLLGNAAAIPYFPHGKCTVSGNPIRKELPGATPAYEAYGFSLDKPVVFITGGSLGARTLNLGMKAGLDKLGDVQVVWQCGKYYYDQYKHLSTDRVKVVDFVADMGGVYTMADLVVCRAGALTIAELEALHKPAILIPSPNVADDHQTKNAESMRRLGGAMVLKDAKAETELVPYMLRLLTDSEALEQMKRALQIPRTNAAETMVATITRRWQMDIAGDPFAKGKKVFFSGIGGIGMSALARLLNTKGCEVSGYDRGSTPLTRQLEQEGMTLAYEVNPEKNLEGIDAVVYTPAVGEDNADLAEARKRRLPVWKRAQLLGEIARRKNTLAVAGTHGKTTTSSLLAYLVTEGGQDPTCFVGGLMTNYDTNYLSGKSNWLIAEADEFDRSFLTLHPQHTILTSLDPDHLDIYGSVEAMRLSYNQLLAQTAKTLVVHESARQFIHTQHSQKVRYYGLNAGDIHAEDIRYEGLATHFAYVAGSLRIRQLLLNRPGEYNLLNALAAITLALEAGVSADSIKKQLPGYKGVKRRFEVHVNTPELVYVDDYAHHPAEISACLDAVKSAWPGYKTVVIFQPHLYSRTRDYYKEFAASLDQADEVYLMHIYPARELSIPHVTVDMIYQQMTHSQKHIINLHEAAEALSATGESPRVVLTLGAGDIDTQVEAIRNKLLI